MHLYTFYKLNIKSKPGFKQKEWMHYLAPRRVSLQTQQSKDSGHLVKQAEAPILRKTEVPASCIQTNSSFLFQQPALKTP